MSPRRPAVARSESGPKMYPGENEKFNTCFWLLKTPELKSIMFHVQRIPTKPYEDSERLFPVSNSRCRTAQCVADQAPLSHYIRKRFGISLVKARPLRYTFASGSRIESLLCLCKNLTNHSAPAIFISLQPSMGSLV